MSRLVHRGLLAYSMHTGKVFRDFSYKSNESLLGTCEE